MITVLHIESDPNNLFSENQTSVFVYYNFGTLLSSSLEPYIYIKYFNSFVKIKTEVHTYRKDRLLI